MIYNLCTQQKNCERFQKQQADEPHWEVNENIGDEIFLGLNQAN